MLAVHERLYLFLCLELNQLITANTGVRGGGAAGASAPPKVLIC